jgi:predicted Zn finger-like uncharacterized protein
MSAITNCPSCQTQFIVTEDQLNQHHGKVRCGHCLHVFNAKDELVISNTQTETNLSSVIDLGINKGVQAPIADVNESSEASTPDNDADDITNSTNNKTRQDAYFNIAEGKSKPTNATTKWLMGIFALVLLLTALAQSTYFLRTEIVTLYPKTKIHLVAACEKIGCSIDLPKHIDLIVIDDSDMQEDAIYAGLIHLSSTLINQANFSQAYPNIELTLTNIDNIPKLRRIFKPNEYLPNHADILKGLGAGEEVKVKLAITAQNEAIAGYRVFVSY